MFKSLRSLVNRRLPSRLTMVQGLTGLVAPPVCALCRAPGQHGDEPWGMDLCRHCEDACIRAHGLCPRCATPKPCSRCSQRTPSYDSAHCLFLYMAPVDDMVTSLKFGHELVFARTLGILMARSLERSVRDLPDCIVPVPLHRRRHIERGFNQSAEIARHVAPRLGIRVDSRLLLRRRATAAQSGLDAPARARNLDQAFVAGGRRMPRRVALLDDVMTTGSTAEAAARTLKAAGCERVELWVCARVLRHGPEDHGV